VNASGGLISNAGIDFYNYGGGVLINSGTITNSTTGIVTNEGAITNTSGSAMNNAGVIDNYGSISNAGTLTNSGFYEDILGRSTNSGTVINSGSMFSRGNNTGTVVNTGSLSWSGGGSVSSGAFINNLGGTLTLSSVTNTGVLINAGTVYFDGPVNNSGTVTNSGAMTIASGDTLTIFGDYEQTGTGILDEQMSPYSQAIFDVSGDAVLDPGAFLDISLLNGYDPLGQTISIMDFSTLSGQFANGSSFWDDNYLWDITYRQHEIDVTAVKAPEPSSLLLLFIGLSALAFFAQRKIYKTRHLA
jgi:hypothetical protein